VRATGLEQDRAARVSQHRHQRHDIFLQQRFATGDLHERAIEFHDRLRDFGERPLLSFVKGIFRVAISAAQIAESETYEDARKANPGTLALDRLINFVNRECLLCRALGLSGNRLLLGDCFQNCSRLSKHLKR